MVKGVSRKVIVVNAPDDHLFEQAIFLVREDYISRVGISSEQILRQARQVADEYALGRKDARRTRLEHLSRPLFAALGAAAASIVWLAVHLLTG